MVQTGLGAGVRSRSGGRNQGTDYRWRALPVGAAPTRSRQRAAAQELWQDSYRRGESFHDLQPCRVPS